MAFRQVPEFGPNIIWRIEVPHMHIGKLKAMWAAYANRTLAMPGLPAHLRVEINTLSKCLDDAEIVYMDVRDDDGEPVRFEAIDR